MKNFVHVLSIITIVLIAITALPYLDTGRGDNLYPVEEVPQRARVLGYDRQTQFGGWQPGVRELVIEQSDAVDPYSGQPLNPEDAEVDHIFPLSAAWDLGAHSWSTADRIRFANDPENLILVSRKQNQQKSDQLPAEWLPADKHARCWYVIRLTKVAFEYHLPLPSADITSGRRQCRFAKTL